MLKTHRWETITGYTRCEKAISIKAGDKLTMEAHYDLTQHRLQVYTMGTYFQEEIANYSISRPRAHGHEGEAEGMAMANYMFARPYART
jgi:hypothetical protein